MFMKLTAGVNFNNILPAAFLYESALHSFSKITICICIFYGKIIPGQKLLSRKILPILTIQNVAGWP